MPVTIDRVLRAFVGQLIGEGRSHADVADLFGTSREQITKYVGNTTTEARTITMDHMRHYADQVDGGVRVLLARLNSIALTMSDDVLTDDEQRTTGVKRGRPRKTVVVSSEQQEQIGVELLSGPPSKKTPPAKQPRKAPRSSPEQPSPPSRSHGSR